MTEYIITDKQLQTATEAYLEHELSRPITEVLISGDKLPEIVRCRDCVWAKPDQSDHEFRELRCNMWIADVSADGFCSRGKREQ